jgi:hypothetical protein
VERRRIIREGKGGKRMRDNRREKRQSRRKGVPRAREEEEGDKLVEKGNKRDAGYVS